MAGNLIHRAVALCAAAALLASLAAAMVAAPASAGTPMCQGREATIVGTNGPDTLTGTGGPDVIVGLDGNDRIFGRGGNDVICGGRGADLVAGNGGADRLIGNAGPDRLFGGSGPDRLFAGVGNDVVVGNHGNDVLDGGRGTDLCLQKQGTGPRVRCELPAVLEPIDLTDVLAIAYTDLNRNHKPDAGDVMIAQLEDTDGNGPDKGDKVFMGMYPTKAKPVWPADFEPWQVKSHAVFDVGWYPGQAVVVTEDGDRLTFEMAGVGWADLFVDEDYLWYSFILDRSGNGRDIIDINRLSPSHPMIAAEDSLRGTGDDYVIDVELLYP